VVYFDLRLAVSVFANSTCVSLAAYRKFDISSTLAFGSLPS